MAEKSGLSIHVRGIVQGVGFRPFVYQLAMKNNLSGWVRNTSDGVDIEITGSNDSLVSFSNELRNSPPPLARIDEYKEEEIILSDNAYAQFSIIESQPDPLHFIPISPDISICPDCLKEMFDPSNRRYRYPFINCTNCGPRFSIIKDIPYDRPFTTMSEFPMCPECRCEYENPLDRRFHAQPTACPVCGPQISFIQNGKSHSSNEAALLDARAAIKQGLIIAVKGLGGYHLACDATNRNAVDTLRQRKRRIDKPFALMSFSLEAIQKYCQVSSEEQDLLESRQKPIVLLNKKTECSLPEELAPGQNTLGFMLPYTPLHFLLLEPSDGFPDALVMTSGNLSEEPIAYEDNDAENRLSSLADAFLTHNRSIHMRVDDSVMRVVNHEPVFTRRSRGFAPDPLRFPLHCDPIFAAGAELKNHFTLTRDAYAFYSHFIGDLENFETLQSYEQAISHYERLFRIKPAILACDLHPDYLSTRYAQNRSQNENLPLLQVQHHHAHMAACMLENGIADKEPVIGLTFDGTGYGTDSAIWGGEILIGNYTGFNRRFRLRYFPLPGGDAAVRTPARTALSLLLTCNIPLDKDIASVQHFSEQELKLIQSQIAHTINSPLTSSMGRLFDAVSSLLGLRHVITYEGQAAIELENRSLTEEIGTYDFSISSEVIDYQPVIEAILADIRSGTPSGIIASRFHNAIAGLCLTACLQIRDETSLSTAAISGGVWQNAYLFTKTVKLLQSNGFRVLTHHRVPTNDACISLGQAAIAAFTNI
jgi:hydrogenase maturation protein HypF